MLFVEWVYLLLFLSLFVFLALVLGNYLGQVFQGETTVLHKGLGWLERATYKITHIDPNAQMDFSKYVKSLFFFHLFGFLFLLLIQAFQFYLPLNFQGFTSVSPLLNANVSMSFVTNTNWQSYAGETTLSNLCQMVGLTSQNFLSAAVGMAVLFALIRGIKQSKTPLIGNFWVDLVRSIIYVLLPLSILLSLFLVTQGVVQTLSSNVEITTLENHAQTIPLGPVASQIAIKQLGTNGGGFFQANSAHPFENPTLLSNLAETLAILLIPGALVYTFGVMLGSKKHALLLFSTMLVLFVGGLLLSLYSENLNNPLMNALPLLEGKETRFGTFQSILWTVSTTATANGSVNAMLSSLSPIAGGVALFNIMLSEIIFGGVGVGLCSMLMFVLLTVFLSGLMIGRTPEYMGKKIEKKEIQWVSVAILLPSALILIGSGISIVLPEALSSLLNKGPHGLSEILYAFTSSAGNNGSSFAGLETNTAFYNVSLAFVMFFGRLSILLPSVAIASHLSNKKKTPSTSATFSTNSFLFFILLLSVIVIIGALTFFPALSLGPIVEHFLMLKGKAF